MKTYSNTETLKFKGRIFEIFLCLLIFPLIFNVLHAQTLPAGFSRVTVASGMDTPIVMDFAPDGRIFIGQQGGDVRIIKNGVLLPTPFVHVDVNFTGERGLVGLVLDPNFQTNGYVYLYYTLPDGSRNRISRFTANGDVAVAGSKVDILNLDLLSAATNHNGGAMKFKEGLLYVAVGENANGANAQNLDTYHGKILRLNPNGTPAAGNPFPTGSVQRRSVWAYGFRNPFTFDIEAGTGRIFVNDVGGDFEEINNVTVPGGNYGWPIVPHGNSTNPAYTNPAFFYERIGAAGSVSQGCAITGGTFLRPTVSNYPAQYIGKYFFVDWCSSWINYIDPANGTRTNFATNNGASVLSVDVGTDGNLYFLRRDGQLYKIIYTNNNAPAITNQPASTTVSEGQPASFTVSSSGATPLNYQWQKNGTNIPGATNPTYTISSTVSSDAGQYRAVVTNAFGTAASNSATLTITAFNAAPVATIINPDANTTYGGGQVISYSGDGSDPEDGALPASAFTWRVDFHHNTHVHPGPALSAGSKTGSFTIPVIGETESTVWYRLYLTVTDSKGLSTTKYVDIQPRTSTITLANQPDKLQLTLDGAPHVTPYTVTGVEGIQRNIGVVSPQVINNVTYEFSNWQHGGTANQDILTPVENTTYTAVFKVVTTKNVVLNPTNDAYVRDGAYSNTNHGTTDPTNLMTKNSGGVNNGFNRESYLTFDLTGVPTNIASVQLKIFGNNGGAPTLTLAAHTVSNTLWSENTINWNNKPAASSAPIATTTINDGIGNYYSLDVTNYVKSEKAAGRNLVSFNLKNVTVTTPQATWNSKERNANIPQLVITTGDSVNTPAAPVANFTVSSTTSCTGQTIVFSNTSTGNITSYEWNFGVGANPATATGTGPHNVLYSSIGQKTISLNVTGPDGSDSEIKTNYITVTNCSNQSPYGGTAQSIPGKIEAENYDIGGQGESFNDLTQGNTGGVYRNDNVDIQATTDVNGGYNVGWVSEGEWIEYTVNVASSANYNFELRVATTQAGRSLHIEMDGINITGSVAIPNTGGWQTWQTVIVPNISLTKGQKIMRVVMETADINFNFANTVLLQSATQTPFGGVARNIPGKIEAEHFDDGGQNISFNDLTPGNSGGGFRNTDVDIEACTDIDGGFNIGWAGGGEWLEYTVNVASTGSYTFDIRVATTQTGKTMHIEFDGVNVTGSIAVPNTGGWQNWQTVRVPNITLTQGQKIMRVVMESTDFNINYINVINSTARLGAIDEQVTLHPNPAQTEIIVYSEIEGPSDVIVTLVNQSGKTVLTKKYTGVNGWLEERIDVSGLQAGSYIFILKSGNKTTSSKLIIY